MSAPDAGAADIDTDVLIVGAGPVGLMCACELARYGVDHVIVDRDEGPRPTSKALIHHVRTQEAMDATGAVDLTNAEGRPLRRVEMHAYGKHIGAWRLDGLPGQYPCPVIIGQDRTEALLEEHLGRVGGKVLWCHRVDEIVQHAEGASAALDTPDGARTVRAKWVIGADGGKATTRKRFAFAFPGGSYRGQQFIQADCRIAWEHPEGASHLYLTGTGYTMVIEMPDDVVRIFISLPDDDPDDDSDPTLDQVERLLAEQSGVTVRLSDPVWLARYRTSHRVATEFRRGRLILAGDAGHIHVPIGGQGMNTGLQDAFALGWIVASVVADPSREHLLDVYAHERHANALDLVGGTDKAYRAILDPNAPQKALTRAVGPVLLGMDSVQEGFRGTLEEINLDTRGGPISVDVGGGGDVRAGDRAPDAPLTDGESLESLRLYDALRDAGWALVLFDAGRDPEELAEAARLARAAGVAALHVARAPMAVGLAGTRLLRDVVGYAHEGWGIALPTVHLVRPDWSVGFRGRPSDTDALEDYLGRHVVPIRANPPRRAPRQRVRALT